SALDAGGANLELDLPPFLQNHLANHLGHMERERRITATRRAPRDVWRDLRGRAALNPNAQLALQPTGPQPPPNVGDMKTFRMCPENGTSISWCDNYQDLRARAAYVGQTIIIYEDSLAPVAGTIDAEYQKIGTEFDQVMYPILANFGRP